MQSTICYCTVHAIVLFMSIVLFMLLYCSWYCTVHVYCTVHIYCTVHVIVLCMSENGENRNDPDLVQPFLKKWWVEPDFKAQNLPLSLLFEGSGYRYYSGMYNYIDIVLFMILYCSCLLYCSWYCTVHVIVQFLLSYCSWYCTVHVIVLFMSLYSDMNNTMTWTVQ
jgi:hypothetical protein